VTGPLDAVIFDWGGTLTPWHTIDLREQWAAYTKVYDPFRADELAGTLLAAEEEAWRRARDHQRSGTLEELLTSVGIEPSGAQHEEALAAYHEFWAPHTYIDPDVPQLLEGLRARGLKVGVLSNTLWARHHHEEVFRRDGVLHLIDGAVYTSEIEWTKPHPAAFRAAMAAVEVDDPSRVVFVGDRPYDDVHGAKEIGMRAVLVPHSAIPENQKGHVEGDPDAIVQRLADLLEVVDEWLAGSVRAAGS
jgi:putative hydrolase of the HAD superfamily